MGAATPATTTLTRAGVPFVLHNYDHDPRTESFGLEAATALGVDPERVFKTLLVAGDSGLACAVVPVAGLLDLKAVAAAVGSKRVAMADPAAAERSTGYVVGGISPVGQRTALPTIVDEYAQVWPTVFVSAGRRGLDLELSPDDLLIVTGGRYAPIART